MMTSEVKTKAKKSQLTYELLPNQILVEDNRIRKTFNRKDAERLIESIRNFGQLQPGVCTRNEEDRIVLVIGERRLRACAALQVPFLFILKEEIIDPYVLKQIELEENLVRENLGWLEEVKAKEELHLIFQKIHGETKPGVRGGHGYKDTAEHLGESRSILHEDVQLSVWARSVPEVAAAKTKTEAKKIVERLEKTIDRRDKLDEALTKGHTESKAITVEGIQIKGEVEDGDRALLEFDRRCILGRMEEKILDFKDESTDVMFFDPPWGVGFDKNKKESSGVQDYEDNPENWDTNLQIWLSLIYRKMALNSHLYMFFPITKHCQIYDILEAVGFETHRLPIIWHKKGAHHVRTPKKWPGRSYEPIAFARKGNKDLVEQGRPDVITTPMPTSRIKDIHPSAKHPEVYRELINRSASPGDTLLDPMAGSGMLGVAAESLRNRYALDWWQIEIDQDYRNLQLLNLVQGYWTITKETQGASAPEYKEPPLANSFEQLRPGTEDWRRYWQTYPEQQPAMLEFAKTQK